MTRSPPIRAELLIIQRCRPQSPDGGVKTPCQLLGGFNFDIDVHSIQFIYLCTLHIHIYHSLTYCTKLVNLCLSMLSLPTIEMYAKPSLPGELVYINAKIEKVLRTSYQLSIKQGLGSASGYLIEKGGRRISSCVRKMPLTLAAKILCIHTGRTCARCPAVALCPSNRDVNKISQTFFTIFKYTSVPTSGGLTMFNKW